MIFFDIDGTLVDHDTAERLAALAFHQDHADAFPESPEKFAVRWREVAGKHIRRHFVGEITFQGQRRARLQELFSPYRTLSDAQADEIFLGYLQRYEESWCLYPDVLGCLGRLSRNALGIISNGDSDQQRRKLDKLGILDRFATVTVSGDIAIAKPAEGIFSAACQAAGRAPSECVYVGDDLEADVKGSRDAGLHPIWLDRQGDAMTKEWLTVRSLSALDEVIEAHDNGVHSTCRGTPWT